MFDAEVAANAPPGGLVVVGFAGGGGSSLAVREAVGRDPDLAMNHKEVCVLTHARNFPRTHHLQADVFEVNPASWRPGQPVGMGWFSPDCTDFSKAKGKAPRSPRIRGLAWSVVPWAVLRRPRVIFVENVEEFEQWGPVYREGHPQAGEPIPERRGETFQRWVSRFRKMGGQVEWRRRRAADFGDPTTRLRLLVIIRFDGQPIVWPEPDHAPRAKAEALGKRPWRGACECIDFSRPCPSIYLTQAEAKAEGLKVQRPLAKNTHGRIFAGVERYVIGAAEPFTVPITHSGDRRAHGVRDPFRTITAAKGGEFALVSPSIVGVGGRRGQSPPIDARDPAPTGTGKADAALVSAFLAPRYGERDGQAPRARDVREPYPTAVPTGNGGQLAAVHLTRHNFGDKPFGDVADPLGTVCAQGNHHGIVTAFMAQGNADHVGRPVTEPVSTLTQRSTQQQLVAAHLSTYYATGVGSDLAEPMRSGTTHDRHALTAAWMLQANTGMVGHDAAEPFSTIVGKGCTQQLVEARLALEGGPIGRRAQVLEWLWSHAGVPTAAEWDDPAATLQGRLKFGLVLIGGAVWMIVDIGLRMLAPDELAAAMGWDGYDLSTDVLGRAVSKVQQTEMIGNGVPKRWAAAHIAANCGFLREPEAVAA
jgi:DNA (cytosine-5)-methyltransferase 1